MRAPLVVVAGTGTEIGKTMVACGLAAAWSQTFRAVAGVKPVESGYAGDGDVDALARVSTFHVKHFPAPYLFVAPVSPHIAARREGRSVDLGVIVDWAERLRSAADGVVLELAGGLFTPLTDHETNADLLVALRPSKVVLVAPDRLGVLHDVLASSRAARAMGIALDALVLSAPERADASTGTNADELRLLLPDGPAIADLPRTDAAGARAALGPVLEALGV